MKNNPPNDMNLFIKPFDIFNMDFQFEIVYFYTMMTMIERRTH